jgi:hypothetical protein
MATVIKPYNAKAKRQAIIVGISKYQNLGVLRDAEPNARLFSERLNQNQNLIVNKMHCLYGKDAKCKDIRKIISDVLHNTDPLDLIIFYFSGYGFMDANGGGYIAPYNMLKDDPFVYGISISELKEVFDGYLGIVNKNSDGNKSANKSVMFLILEWYSANKDQQTVYDFEKFVLMNFLGKSVLPLASTKKLTTCLVDGLASKQLESKAGIVTIHDVYSYVTNKMNVDDEAYQDKISTTIQQIGNIPLFINQEKFYGFLKEKLHNFYKYELLSGEVLHLKYALQSIDKLRNLFKAVEPLALPIDTNGILRTLEDDISVILLHDYKNKIDDYFTKLKNLGLIEQIELKLKEIEDGPILDKMKILNESIHISQPIEAYLNYENYKALVGMEKGIGVLCVIMSVCKITKRNPTVDDIEVKDISEFMHIFMNYMALATKEDIDIDIGSAKRSIGGTDQT